MAVEQHREQFSGSRLRVARAFNGLTQTKLASKVEVTHQFIAGLENDRKEPSGSLAQALGDVLGFESSFFYGPPLDEFKQAECNFRSLQTTPVSARSQAMACGTLLGQFLSYANEQVTLPVQQIPTMKVGSREEIERAAERCRMQWGLGLDVPITNMVRLTESIAGVAVAQFDEITHKVDAFSRAGNPSVVILNKKSPSRCRFDLAHECGHLVLHFGKPTGSHEMERQADLFASALLLPRAGFVREFPRTLYAIWDALFRLKARWRVSLAALIHRAADLSLVDAVQYRRLYKQLSARNWLKHEPHEFDPEEPEIIPLVFEALRDHHGLKPSELANELGWKLRTLQKITGVVIEPPEPKPQKTNVLVFPSQSVKERAPRV
jgi:Zn-dependent peptidase ImmA (M78 family)/DNA-binding XRE family transcriptional regulator